MDAFEPLFGKVTLSSLSGDIVISIVLIIGLSLYIYQKGVKDIFILALSLYIGQVVVSVFSWDIPKIGNLPGDAVLFILFSLIVNWALQISALGSGLSISKKNLGLNLLFGVSVAGLLLVNILSVIKTQDKSILNTIEKSLFNKDSFQVFWTVSPLLFLPFLKPAIKKSSSKKK